MDYTTCCVDIKIVQLHTCNYEITWGKGQLELVSLVTVSDDKSVQVLGAADLELGVLLGLHDLDSCIWRPENKMEEQTMAERFDKQRFQQKPRIEHQISFITTIQQRIYFLHLASLRRAVRRNSLISLICLGILGTLK